MSILRPTIVTRYADKPAHGLSAEELDRLAIYNAEMARGIVHTNSYSSEMRKLQARFDSA